MIRKPFLLKLFDAANMQRWNDKIRPVDLRELDKQAHKMILAFVLGKLEEQNPSKGFDWIKIIEGGIFEFLQRLVVTDLKPQIFHKIKEDRNKYIELNNWVYKKIEPTIAPIGDNFCRKFKEYLLDTTDNINKRILSAAHFYATRWEFNIIERANPGGFEITEIKVNLQKIQEEYYILKGIKELTLYSNLRNFVDLCGQLRFQVRWAHLHMVPKTSVLGHMLIVGLLSYLFSVQIKACKKRCINNYFTGLFHDLPEVLTRDIIDPVKRSVRGLSGIIRKYEKREMRDKIFNLIPKDWHSEMKMFTENEYKSIITIKGKIERKNSDDISKNFNKNKYNPRDGEIVEAADHLAAFIESHLSLESGIKSEELQKAKSSLLEKYRNKTISGIKFGEIYPDFGS